MLKIFFSRQSLKSKQFADFFLTNYIKDYKPVDRAIHLTKDQGFVLAAKSNDLPILEGYRVEIDSDISNPGVFDFLNQTWIDSDLVGAKLSFEISLKGKDAVGIYLLKSKNNPCLIFADGKDYHPLSIEDGVYANNSLTFSFAKRALVYSPEKPLEIKSNQKIDSQYIPSKKLLILHSNEKFNEVKIEF